MTKVKANVEKAWDCLRQKSNRRNLRVKVAKQDFIRWYNKEEKKCHYCKIPESKFIEIWGPFYGGKRGWRPRNFC